MATKYGVGATNILNTSIPKLAEQGESGGHWREIYDTYALTADLASGDVIRMGAKLPAAARVVDVRLYFTDLDVSGGTLDVGWLVGDAAVEAASAAGFGSAISVTSAGVYSMFTSQSTVAGFMKTFSEAVQCVVTTNGDTDATSGTITLQVIYVID